MPSPPAPPKALVPGQVVKEKYEIVKTLGQGGFGAVFQAKDKKTSDLYALKLELEPPKGEEPGLELEISVIKRMQTSSHVVRFIDSGKIETFTFVVMQLAGCNLSDLRKACPQMKFTENTSVRLALQSMEAIEHMHAAGLLHRDIKPANFAMGRTTKDYRNVYILDFGMVRRYRTKGGAVRPPRPVCGFRGTVKYASVNCHDGIDLGRVDDLWSWYYMVIEFIKGDLPWRVEADRNKIRQIKARSKGKMIEGLEKEFERIFASLESFKYADEVPCHWYKQQFNQLMSRKSYVPGDPFDWEEKGAFFEQLKNVCPQPYEKQMQSTRKVIKEKTVGEEQSTEEESKESSAG